MQVALLCCYPLFVHISIVLQIPSYRIAALVLLATGILYRELKNRSWTAWLTLLLVTALVVIASQIDHWLYAFYLPPVLIPALIASIFIRSLLPGNEPLVTAIGERARGPLTSEMRIYTKRVTLVWAIFLSITAVLGLALPFAANEQVWSIYTNFISYISVAVLFIGEFVYRRYRFKNHNHPSFREYLNIVLRAGKQNGQS